MVLVAVVARMFVALKRLRVRLCGPAVEYYCRASAADSYMHSFLPFLLRAHVCDCLSFVILHKRALCL